MAKLTPRERRQARTREEILSAAMEIINEEGPESFSLRELARRVDYSPAALYEYFDGKDDIIEAVCAEGNRRLRTYLRSVPETLPPKERLVKLLLAYVRFAQRHVEHFMLMFNQVASGPKIPYEMVKGDETYQILLDAVQAGIKAGVIVTREGYGLDEIAYSFWALAHGQATLQLTNLRNVEYDFAAADRASVETLLRGLALSADR